MNYRRIEAVAEMLSDYASYLKDSAKNGTIDEEATDGIARMLLRLEELGVSIEVLDN